MPDNNAFAVDRKSMTKPACETVDTGSDFLVAAILFSIFSSVLFAALFEWPRYRIILSLGFQRLDFLDNVILFWLLVAKSMFWLVPVLAACFVLRALKLRKTSVIVFISSWIGIFYFMAIDLVAVVFTGYHVWEYWLPPGALLSEPIRHLRRWIAQNPVLEEFMIFSAFALIGVIGFLCCRGMIRRVEVRSSRLSFFRPVVSPITCYVLVVFGVFPGLVLFNDTNVLDRFVVTASPIYDLHDRVMSLTAALRGSFVGSGEEQSISRVLGEDPHETRNGRGSVHEAFAGVIGALQPAARAEQLYEQEVINDRLTAERVANEAINPGPVDSTAFVRRSSLPNIILIIFESFRHNAISPGLMSELDAWSRQGLRLQRHYSGSNCSHLGLFSLFYGRCALGYYQTLDRNIPPQLLESLRRSGYRITFLTSGETKGHRGFDGFFNDTYCDEVVLENEIIGHDMSTWPASDRGKLARLKEIIGAPRKQPQCVFFYLMSSHWGYPFPPEFDILRQASVFRRFFRPSEETRSHMNRYANSLHFLEHELMKVLRSLDLTQNLVVITGDHGESMGEDGVFRHGNKMSDIQMRVPCVIVGPGAEPRTISSATSHPDLVPTLLHILGGKGLTINNCQGRDLMEARAPSDEVLLAPANGIGWEGVLIVRGNKRFVFETRTDAGILDARFAGFVDEAGLYKLRIEDK